MNSENFFIILQYYFTFLLINRDARVAKLPIYIAVLGCMATTSILSFVKEQYWKYLHNIRYFETIIIFFNIWLKIKE